MSSESPYRCQKKERSLDKPCCPEPDEACKFRSDCPTYFAMNENKSKGCPEHKHAGAKRPGRKP